MRLFANLHTHSTHSDGEYTPSELVQTAKKEGYHAIALTDHDTITGCKELEAECRAAGLEYIFGAELSTSNTLGTSFHIVGFDFDPNYPPMQKHLEEMSLRETHQTQTLFQNGIDRGTISGVAWEEVLQYNQGISWLCNNHVFRTMIAKGLVKMTDYPEFFAVNYGSRRDEIPPLYPFKPVEVIINLIKEAGGIAVLAHPQMKQLDCIDALIEMGLDGIEAWHYHVNDAERKRALQYAIKKGLYVSGGSDHAGLCGGSYARYESIKDCPFYVEPCSVGTTEQFFRELKTRQKSSERRTLNACQCYMGRASIC